MVKVKRREDSFFGNIINQLRRRSNVRVVLLIVVLSMTLPSFFHAYKLVHSSSHEVTSNLPPLTHIPSRKNKHQELSSHVKKIGHAISLVTCKDANAMKGYLAALIILRHSIHRNSVHEHPNSKYSYQMYAIIHSDGGCTKYAAHLRRLGYITIIRPTPVNISAIPEDNWYRNHVENENCCGSKEFIKLYAYTLTQHPVVVHWDLDVAILKPMDDLFDAIIYDKDSPQGKAARAKLQIQRPWYQTLPDRIDAFFTRDITSSKPWEEHNAIQGGFLVARPSNENFEMYKQLIMEANYTPGRGLGTGWGGMGYGGFQGAMAYQGVTAYFYDQVYPGHAVELDACRWNQCVADVIWRGPERKEFIGQCRQYPYDGNFTANTPENGMCEDCRALNVEETRTVHFTACKKPWDCSIPYPRVPRDKSQVYRLAELTNVTTCGLLFREYFEIRKDIEKKIAQKLGVKAEPAQGKHHPEYFAGYCSSARNYVEMKVPDTLKMKEVYGF